MVSNRSAAAEAVTLDIPLATNLGTYRTVANIQSQP